MSRVPIPTPACTHTHEHGYGFSAGVGAGTARVTGGLPVLCTSSTSSSFVLLHLTASYLALPHCTSFYLILLCFSSFYLILLHHTPSTLLLLYIFEHTSPVLAPCTPCRSLLYSAAITCECTSVLRPCAHSVLFRKADQTEKETGGTEVNIQTGDTGGNI